MCVLLARAYPFSWRRLLQDHSEYGKALVTVSDFLNQQMVFGEKLIRSVSRKEERNRYLLSCCFKKKSEVLRVKSSLYSQGT